MRISLRKLPRSFYLRHTPTVARDLLGKYLVRRLGSKRLSGKIVEAEAYCEGDPASHSYRGMTKRNEVMFWEGGYLYVYFTYGMHYCANIVTRKEGIGEAVLIRAVDPVEGVEKMIRNRAGSKKNGMMDDWNDGHLVTLTNGPAKVCEAFGIARKHNGIDLCGDEIFIAASFSPQSAFPARPTESHEAGGRNPEFPIASSPRIGIRSGREKKWRFCLAGNAWVSKVKPPG